MIVPFLKLSGGASRGASTGETGVGGTGFSGSSDIRLEAKVGEAGRIIKLSLTASGCIDFFEEFIVKKAYIVILLSAIVGFAISILMTKMHYQIGAIGLDERSFCHVSDLFDCDSAMASRYAKIGRFLNSEIGILYYILVLAGVLYAWLADDGKATLAYLFVSAIFAVGYSIVMAYLSFYKLGVLCLLCLTIYLANLILMAVLPLALRIRYRDIPKFLIGYVKSIFVSETNMKPRFGIHLGATIVLLGLGLIFFKGLNPKIHEAHAEVPRDVYLKAF